MQSNQPSVVSARRHLPIPTVSSKRASEASRLLLMECCTRLLPYGAWWLVAAGEGERERMREREARRSPTAPEGASGRERAPYAGMSCLPRRLRGRREREQEWAALALHDFAGVAACSRVCALHGGMAAGAAAGGRAQRQRTPAQFWAHRSWGVGNSWDVRASTASPGFYRWGVAAARLLHQETAVF